MFLGIAFFLAFLPLLTTVTLNWPAGLVAEGLVAGLAWWLAHNQLVPAPFASYSTRSSWVCFSSICWSRICSVSFRARS